MKTTMFCDDYDYDDDDDDNDDDDDDDLTSTQGEFGEEFDTSKFILNNNDADFFTDRDDESNETLTDEMICLQTR